MRTLLVTLAATLSLVACLGSPPRVHAYDGPPRPDAEVARVRLRSTVRGLDLELVEVDGTTASLFEWQELVLLPGEHELWIEAEDPEEERVFFDAQGAVTWQRPAEATLTFDAASGAAYLVRVDETADGPRLELVEVVDAPPTAPPPAVAAPTAEEPVQRVVRTPAAPPDPGAPYALVLGTAQDGGLPQVGCEDEACALARRDPSRRRLVTSLLLVDPRTSSRWLFEATPDLREQVAAAAGHPAGRSSAPQPGGARPALFDGVFLTHAHMGHYSGLLHLGREAYGARDLPLHVSERMAGFLESNEPWRTMIAQQNFRIARLAPGRPLALAPDLSVEAFTVPHRDEYSDTLGFVVRGPRRSLLFLPDIDKWERWDERVEDRIAGVDVALLDGTFYAAWELPGRDMSEIPHPFLVESVARFQNLPAAERAKIAFLHLNHTNPIADPRSPEAAAVRAAGMRVVSELERIDL